MKKRMLAGMMAFIMAGMLTACGSSSSVSESAKSGEDKENKTNTGSAEDGNSGSASVVLKLGHIQSESDLWNLGAVKFADRVSELSNGDIKIEIYPNRWMIRTTAACWRCSGSTMYVTFSTTAAMIPWIPATRYPNSCSNPAMNAA